MLKSSHPTRSKPQSYSSSIMKLMATQTELQACYDRLYTYDVTQGAWEQEPNGFEANAKHVLSHLVKDLITKDFNDPETVREEIAPDSLQYALRFARWADLSPTDIAYQERDKKIVDSTVTKLGGVATHFAAFAEGAGTLARNLHDLDHASKRVEALEWRRPFMMVTSRMLMLSADLASETFDFDLVEAFDTRLAVLRVRFDIPEPEVV